MKTYFTLLQILLAEVERFAVEDSNNSKDAALGADKITLVARRVLPALRNYSSWLLTVNHHLVAYKEKDTPLAVQLPEFWKVYANTLTLLASTFDVVSLPEVEYLLEEDEETLYFIPLGKGATLRRYQDSKGQQKPSINDPGVERNHPNIEMLYRIREFVIDGLDLVVSNVRSPFVQSHASTNLFRKYLSLLLMMKTRKHSFTKKMGCHRNSSLVPQAITLHSLQQASNEKTCISKKLTTTQMLEALSGAPSPHLSPCQPTCMAFSKALNAWSNLILTRTLLHHHHQSLTR